MVVECTIDVGFHSDFDTFGQIEPSKTPPMLAIINGLPFNPTYELLMHVRTSDYRGIWDF